MALKTVKFLSGIASPTWSYNAGDITEMPEADARSYIGMGIAVEIGANACPHCGGELEPRTPPGLEAAAMAHAPARRGRG